VVSASLQVEVEGCHAVVVARSEVDGETALIVETASEVVEVSGSRELDDDTLEEDDGCADEVVKMSVEIDDARLEVDKDSRDDEDTGVEVEIALIDVDDAVGVAEQ
jgi:hypothetical protein